VTARQSSRHKRPSYKRCRQVARALRVLLQVLAVEPGTATIKRTSTSGTNVKILVSCTRAAGATCSLALRLTVKETIKRGKVIAAAARAKLKKKVVVVGTTPVTLGTGQSKTVTVSLNAVGKRLLAQRHTPKVKVAITQSTNTVFRTTITFRRQLKKKH
jgi:predicted methyltransferase